MAWLSHDGGLILLSRTVRTFAYGFLAVVLGVYLRDLGYDATQIGIVVSASLIGSAFLTLALSSVADHVGRRRVLTFCSALMALSGAAFALTDSFWILLAATLTGTVSATSSEVGPFLSLEMAILPRTAPDERRTRLFSVYNLLGSGATAAGSLFTGAIGALTAIFSDDALLAGRLLFWLYATLALANLSIVLRLTEAVEQAPVARPASLLGLHRSRGRVFGLAALFSLDSFGGGFVIQSLIAYWFVLRFDLGLESLGPIFFGANVLAALSYLAAEKVAARIGLLNTMVFSHLPSEVLLVLIPLMPTAELAVACLLLRQSISQMDVPTRQSYLMAVVEPDERTAAAGLTNVARQVTQAISPALAGLSLNLAALGLPFFLAGGLKAIYDVALLVAFRKVRPPEEEARADGGDAARRRALP
ncbi:MAG: MFS transporter [Chloroflexi bacterium]|nr:MFS transporter [Chloroflexota bacterium]